MEDLTVRSKTVLDILGIETVEQLGEECFDE